MHERKYHVTTKSLSRNSPHTCNSILSIRSNHLQSELSLHDVLVFVLATFATDDSRQTSTSLSERLSECESHSNETGKAPNLTRTIRKAHGEVAALLSCSQVLRFVIGHTLCSARWRRHSSEKHRQWAVDVRIWICGPQALKHFTLQFFSWNKASHFQTLRNNLRAGGLERGKAVLTGTRCSNSNFTSKSTTASVSTFNPAVLFAALKSAEVAPRHPIPKEEASWRWVSCLPCLSLSSSLCLRFEA